jgi:FMN phosphatase YigB (HAD superfamily)
MCESAGVCPGSRRSDAEQMFELWLSERHAAASRMLFDGAAAAVAEARRLHPDAAIAAITNGSGDPLAMPELAALFDFTVSAEDASIYPNRKPAREPFLAALRVAGCAARPSEWAHVGDDLINDVQASRALGAWAA